MAKAKGKHFWVSEAAYAVLMKHRHEGQSLGGVIIELGESHDAKK